MLRESKKPRRHNSTAWIFVHGFMGSSNDLRYIRDILKMKLEMQNDDHKYTFMLCKKFYGENTQILELGFNLCREIK